MGSVTYYRCSITVQCSITEYQDRAIIMMGSYTGGTRLPSVVLKMANVHDTKVVLPGNF